MKATQDLVKFVSDTVQAACDLYGVSFPGGVKVQNRASQLNRAGFFTPSDGSMTINVRACRTKRDIVFAIGHEVGHAIQFSKMQNAMHFMYQLEVFTFGYSKAPMEIEADMKGFEFESKLNYKNEVLHRDVDSVFIGRKVFRSASF